MVPISIELDDESHALLLAVCAKQGRDPADLLGDLLRRYLAATQGQQGRPGAAVAPLDPDLAAEAAALAEAGMGDYHDLLRRADEP